jgi:hypothetical protein
MSGARKSVNASRVVEGLCVTLLLFSSQYVFVQCNTSEIRNMDGNAFNECRRDRRAKGFFQYAQIYLAWIEIGAFCAVQEVIRPRINPIFSSAKHVIYPRRRMTKQSGRLSEVATMD